MSWPKKTSLVPPPISRSFDEFYSWRACSSYTAIWDMWAYRENTFEGNYDEYMLADRWERLMWELGLIDHWILAHYELAMLDKKIMHDSYIAQETRYLQLQRRADLKEVRAMALWLMDRDDGVSDYLEIPTRC